MPRRVPDLAKLRALIGYEPRGPARRDPRPRDRLLHLRRHPPVKPAEYRRMRDAEETQWWYVGQRAIARALLESALGPGDPATAAARLLDTGCGTGGNLVHLARLGAVGRVAGVDTAPEAVAACRAERVVGGPWEPPRTAVRRSLGRRRHVLRRDLPRLGARRSRRDEGDVPRSATRGGAARPGAGPRDPAGRPRRRGRHAPPLHPGRARRPPRGARSRGRAIHLRELLPASPAPGPPHPRPGPRAARARTWASCPRPSSGSSGASSSPRPPSCAGGSPSPSARASLPSVGRPYDGSSSERPPMTEGRRNVADELRRVRDDVRRRAGLDEEPGPARPSPRPARLREVVPMEEPRAPEPAPETPDATGVNESWRAEPVAPRGLRGALFRALDRVLRPRFDAQQSLQRATGPARQRDPAAPRGAHLGHPPPLRRDPRALRPSPGGDRRAAHDRAGGAGGPRGGPRRGGSTSFSPRASGAGSRSSTSCGTCAAPRGAEDDLQPGA